MQPILLQGMLRALRHSGVEWKGRVIVV
jgi:hypothetical protein